MIVLSNDETIMESMKRLWGVPASSLSQLRGPWTENVEDPCSNNNKLYLYSTFHTATAAQSASHKQKQHHNCFTKK